MTTVPPKSPRIKALTRPANGSSQPWFCLLDDDSSWLVKFSGSGPGVDALLAEYIANSLGRLWGFPIPECKPVYLDKELPRAGTDEFWDVLSASEGWNLAIRTIPDAENHTPSLQLSSSTLEAMLAFDTLLANWDRTTMSRNLMQDGQGKLWWIDHGSCRFLHNLKTPPPLKLPQTHFLFEAKDSIEPLPLPALGLPVIRELLANVPSQWLSTLNTGPGNLATELSGYLEAQTLKSKPSVLA
ncbi:MAG: hypothetical protein JKY56_20175 [Kofleriaceae bacterium]|nr:hypothetical protein [Kofleriaceae bacterium]